MAGLERTPSVPLVDGLDVAATLPGSPRSLAVPALIAGSWATLLVAEATGTAAAIHHHALIEDGPPLAIAVALFLVGWLVMVAAMMLPASLPTIQGVETATSRLTQPRRARSVFLGSFALVWTIFGLVAFLGDAGLHQVVDATPWLAARPWLIEAGILALAGGYQLVPLKRRSLAACCHPAQPAVTALLVPGDAGRVGLHHGLACLGSSWALMLLMFAEGFASIGWMVALTAVMTYEATGRHGPRAASIAGVVLVLAALATLTGVSSTAL
jgi:predicted metal-binding membrane protein